MFLLEFTGEVFFGEGMGKGIADEAELYHHPEIASPFSSKPRPLRKWLKVSPRSPSRTVSRGITSAGAIFPRFTLEPSSLTNKTDRKSTRLNSNHKCAYTIPSST